MITEERFAWPEDHSRQKPEQSRVAQARVEAR